MEQATKTIHAHILRCSKPSESNGIRQHLKELLKLAEEKHRSLEEGERTDGLNFKGKEAVSCFACANTVDPNGDYVGTCEECNKVACTECICDCNLCDKTLCVENCGLYCEFCEEYVCKECTVECESHCGCDKEAVCADCVKPVGPPEWQCCPDCVDRWVEDGWREY